jgi:hypothetical protein
MCCLPMLSTVHTAMEGIQGRVGTGNAPSRRVPVERLSRWALVCMLLQATARTPLECSWDKHPRQTTNSRIGNRREGLQLAAAHSWCGIFTVHRLCFMSLRCCYSGQHTEDTLRRQISSLELVGALAAGAFPRFWWRDLFFGRVVAAELAQKHTNYYYCSAEASEVYQSMSRTLAHETTVMSLNGAQHWHARGTHTHTQQQQHSWYAHALAKSSRVHGMLWQAS